MQNIQKKKLTLRECIKIGIIKIMKIKLIAFVFLFFSFYSSCFASEKFINYFCDKHIAIEESFSSCVSEQTKARNDFIVMIVLYGDLKGKEEADKLSDMYNAMLFEYGYVYIYIKLRKQFIQDFKPKNDN